MSVLYLQIDIIDIFVADSGVSMDLKFYSLDFRVDVI